MDAQTARDVGEAEIARRLHGLTVRRAGLAVGLWGEAGIGKTYTVQRWLRGLPARSLSLAASAPLADWARRLPRPAKVPMWVSKALENLQGGGAVQATSLSDALGAVLAGLSPFVLHLEDLHEADPERVALVERLAGLATRSRGVGLIVTSRHPLPPGLDGHRQEPLTPGAAAALLQAEAGASLPQAAMDWIYDRATGNPLFTLEYFRLLARQGQLWNDAQRWHWRAPQAESMPVTVEALIERALQDVLGPGPLGEVAGARALLPGATAPVWAAVAGLEPQALTEISAELERCRVLLQGQFVHPLYREVVLRHLGPAQRRTLARRALLALEHDPEAAAHFIGSAELEPAEAVERLKQAASWASAAGRTAGAARLLAQAADLASGDQQPGLALQAARALETIDAPEALRLAQLAAQLWPDDLETALYLAGRLVQRSRNLADADEVLARFPHSVRLGPEWTGWQITWMMGSGQYAGALALWQDHPELHELPSPGLCYSVAVCLAQTGQFEQATAQASRGLALGDVTPTQRASLLNVSSMTCAFMGQAEAAEAHLTAALALAHEHGLHQMLGALLQNRAKNLERTDHFAGALLAAEGAFQAYGEAGDLLRQANAGVLVAGHLTEFGRYQEAETFLLDSLALLERQGPSRFLVVAQTTLASLYRDWQPPHGAVLALKLARNALEHARQLGPVSSVTVFALASLARAEAAFGDLEQAQLHVQEAVAAAQQSPDESTFLACSALAAVQLASAQPEQARLALQQALTAATAGSFTLDVQRLRLELARLDQDLGAAHELHAWFRANRLLNGAFLAERAFAQLQIAHQGALGNHETDTAALPQLDVLGVMRFAVAGAVQPVRGRKRQELLAALLEGQLRGASEVSRPELLDLLYPGSDELQASASLKELVHLTRTVLGAGVIQTTPGGYALGEVMSDAARFLEGGDTRLWRGPYLHGLTSGQRDDSVADALHLALRARTEALLEHDPQEAARTARLLLEAEPYAPELLALALATLRACGNHRSLQRVYQEARLRMSELGETLPEHWGDFLAAQTS
jgi:hypothetical protein